MKTLARDYARAYADCYRWLYRVCPPWRWLLSTAYIPGSPLMRELAEIRRLAEGGTTR
jgi:hypothetical protein